MADNLPDTVENALLDLLCRGTAYTVTTPIKARLMTANGSDSASGTELGTSGGYTALGATITFGSAAASGTISNTAAVTWTNMPATTVVGLELWSSDGTPKRLWWGALASSKTVASGDTFEFAIGAVVCTLA
jgi:hypothetical protein